MCSGAPQKMEEEELKRSIAEAKRFLAEEKARLGDPGLVANFLSTRSFGRIEREATGQASPKPRPSIPESCGELEE